MVSLTLRTHIVLVVYAAVDLLIQELTCGWSSTTDPLYMQRHSYAWGRKFTFTATLRRHIHCSSIQGVFFEWNSKTCG